MKKVTILIIVLLFFQHLHATNLPDLIDSVRVGDYAFGGIVFLVDESGQHGLVCALKDQVRGIRWNDGIIDSLKLEPIKNSTNQVNKTTNNFIKEENTQSENLATKVCAEYSVSVNGVLFDDWYLPSKEEVYRMYENRTIIDKNAIKNGGSYFTTNNELSPTEFCNSPAWDQVFNYGYRNYDYKKSKINVRAVRAF